MTGIITHPTKFYVPRPGKKNRQESPRYNQFGFSFLVLSEACALPLPYVFFHPRRLSAPEATAAGPAAEA